MDPSIPVVVQSSYYVVTGLWPLLHLPSFLWVTGPKHDLWLVRTVGVLLVVIGATLALAVLRGGIVPEIVLLGATTAVGLLVIDAVCAVRRIVSRIYLVDAAIQLMLVAGWLVAVGGWRG
jgi:hypothetical protein